MVVSSSQQDAAVPADSQPVNNDTAEIIQLNVNAPDYQARVAELVQQGYDWSPKDAGFRKAS